MLTKKKSEKNLAKFIEKSEKDQALKNRLKAASEGYKGDPTDIDGMISQTVLPIAREEKLEFTLEDYKDYLRRKINRELAVRLSDDVLDHVAGGVGDVEAPQTVVEGDQVIIDNSQTTNIIIVINIGPDTTPEQLEYLAKLLNQQNQNNLPTGS